MSAYPAQSQFAEQVGTVFVARPAGERDESVLGVELRLDAVRPGTHSDTHEWYSLEFLGETALDQATYSLAHQVLGVHDVFLVPVAREGTATRYEAVFNVAKESEG